jgi:hypothetical protein
MACKAAEQKGPVLLSLNRRKRDHGAAAPSGDRM